MLNAAWLDEAEPSQEIRPSDSFTIAAIRTAARVIDRPLVGDKGAIPPLESKIRGIGETVPIHSCSSYIHQNR